MKERSLLDDLAKIYEPKQFESKWYDFWESNGYFQPSSDAKKDAFCIVIPPPNITSKLHMGHGLNNTIQDVLVRWKRMQGHQVLWMPGTDHAGIATQNVVERHLKKNEGKRRQDLSRHDFLKRVYEWNDEYGHVIQKQLKKMGCSCDWSRMNFTMSPHFSSAVREAFCRFYDDGLIYRGNYIVNWCPRCDSALSHEEVEHRDEDGKLYWIRYSIGEHDSIVVATTRPETLFGDQAVMVHPDDSRYQDKIGQMAILPVSNRAIPVIADSAVKIDFGSGAVKVTPAHDANDFIVGKRHHLKPLKVMTTDGIMNEEAGSYKGMDRFECRRAIVHFLKENNQLVREEPYVHAIGLCYRCSTVVEPYLSNQWFVRMKSLAQRAIDVVENGQIQFFPHKWKKSYLHWMHHIEDWCISRQIWWGHQMPVWSCNDCNKITVVEGEVACCQHCFSVRVVREPDVLDTWFSSMLWPFATLGWPKETSDLNRFYPTQVLSTAPEIIFFWVARMIMAGLYFMDNIPFSRVYMHSTVRDKIGRKMSKSLGNGIDPLEVIDKHGADALRFTIIYLSVNGQDIRLSFNDKQDDFLIGKRLANKIWNASRYILTNLQARQLDSQLFSSDECILIDDLSLIDQWILSRLHLLMDGCNTDLECFEFSNFARRLYDFVWHDFCDWYLEWSKLDLYGQNLESQQRVMSVLIYVLRQFLTLLHPVMPFLTEEIWQQLPHQGKSITKQPYPQKNQPWINEQAMMHIQNIQEIIIQLRQVRGELNILSQKKMSLFFNTSSIDVQCLISQQQWLICSLANVDKIHINLPSKSLPQLKKVHIIGSQYQMTICLEGLVDDLDKETKRLQKDFNKEVQWMQMSLKKLNHPQFVDKAPEKVIQQERQRLDLSQKRMDQIKRILKQISI